MKLRLRGGLQIKRANALKPFSSPLHRIVQKFNYLSPYTNTSTCQKIITCLLMPTCLKKFGFPHPNTPKISVPPLICRPPPRPSLINGPLLQGALTFLGIDFQRQTYLLSFCIFGGPLEQSFHFTKNFLPLPMLQPR